MGVVTMASPWLCAGSHQPSKHTLWQPVICRGPSITPGIPPLWSPARWSEPELRLPPAGCTCKLEALKSQGSESIPKWDANAHNLRRAEGNDPQLTPKMQWDDFTYLKSDGGWGVEREEMIGGKLQPPRGSND